MKAPHLRSVYFAALALLLASFAGCTSHRDNPDEIRERTAQATETVRRDAKAMAEGLKEGMSSDRAVNINNASREDLLSLPGLTEHEADRIIAERPFKDTHELVARHIIPEAEYDKISNRLMAGH
ncbi:MAG: helix-hairpin-helix domain-containing protein [Candidatus Sulfotelmatobacter sp.]